MRFGMYADWHDPTSILPTTTISMPMPMPMPMPRPRPMLGRRLAPASRCCARSCASATSSSAALQAARHPANACSPVSAPALRLGRRNIHVSATRGAPIAQAAPAAGGAAVYFPGARPAPDDRAGPGAGSVLRVEQAEPGLWVVAFTGAETEDNRLTPYLLEAYLEALAYIEAWWDALPAAGRAPGGAVVTTGQTHRGAKFFSNGLDLALAFATPRFFDWPLGATLQRLLTFRLPTVAALGGHTFAGAFALAMAHDYRVMNSQRGFMCMNEIAFGAHIPAAMSAVVRAKVGDPCVLRKVFLEGHRFAGPEALAAGLVDHLMPAAAAAGDAKNITTITPQDISDLPQAVLTRAVDLARQLRPLAATDAYGKNKAVYYVDALTQMIAKEDDFFARVQRLSKPITSK